MAERAAVASAGVARTRRRVGAVGHDHWHAAHGTEHVVETIGALAVDERGKVRRAVAEGADLHDAVFG